MNNPISIGTNSATTADWLRATQDMKLTASEASMVRTVDLVEPAEAIYLPAHDREHMNHAPREARNRY